MNPLGFILFWTQFGFGLFFFVGLLISIGFLVWCREKHRLPRVNPGHNERHQEAVVQGPKAAPHQEAVVQGPEAAPHQEAIVQGPEAAPHQKAVVQGPEAAPHQEAQTETQCSGRPVISYPISDFNAAWDKPDSSSESFYNEAVDYTEPYSKNPFQGWIRPIGPPPPPPPEAFAMVVRPVPKINRSTMTLESDFSMTKRSSKTSSEWKSGYAASPETSLERNGTANKMTGARPKRTNQAYNQSNQAFDEGPAHRELPPLPVRSTSLKRKNKRKRRTADNSTAATIS